MKTYLIIIILFIFPYMIYANETNKIKVLSGTGKGTTNNRPKTQKMSTRSKLTGLHRAEYGQPNILDKGIYLWCDKSNIWQMLCTGLLNNVSVTISTFGKIDVINCASNFYIQSTSNEVKFIFNNKNAITTFCVLGKYIDCSVKIDGQSDINKLYLCSEKLNPDNNPFKIVNQYFKKEKEKGKKKKTKESETSSIGKSSAGMGFGCGMGIRKK